MQAMDTSGALVGEFAPNEPGRGGTLRWGGRELTLRATGSIWQERYALLDGRRELGRFAGRRWGRRPVRGSLVDDATFEPGLVLFAAFVVRGLAEYAAQ
jgi:hypothetical protein